LQKHPKSLQKYPKSSQKHLPNHHKNIRNHCKNIPNHCKNIPNHCENISQIIAENQKRHKQNCFNSFYLPGAKRWQVKKFLGLSHSPSEDVEAFAAEPGLEGSVHYKVKP
jgi:hypothetical protein